MAARFQLVNNSTADDTVYLLEHFRWLQSRIRYRVKVVRHDDIGVNRKTSGCSRFLESGACNKSECFGAKNGQAIFCYGSEIERRNVSGDLMHEAKPQRLGLRSTEKLSLSAHQAAKPQSSEAAHQTASRNPLKPFRIDYKAAPGP